MRARSPLDLRDAHAIALHWTADHVRSRWPAGLRLLVLNYEYPPLGGGAGVATASLVRRLASRGAYVDVVTSRPSGVRDDDRELGMRCIREADRLTVFRVRSYRRHVHQAGFRGAGSYLLAALPVIRRLTSGRAYDAAHVFFSLPTGALLPVLARRGIPSVLSLRGSDVPGYDDRNRALVLAHGLLRPVTRRIWHRADRVVAVCRSLGELAQRTDPRLDFRVIGNGVDLELFRPRGRPREPGAPVRCLAVSRLIERKGVADLLHAWRVLERGRYALEIVGSGPAEQALRALARELELGEEVRFAGPLDRRSVAARYADADLFTLAPYEEAFGNVFAEALAAGLPVVGSRVGAIPELVVDGTNGILVPPGSPDAIAAAVRELANDPRRRKEMALRNRARAESTLSWDVVADSYLSTYAELAVHRRPALAGAAVTAP